MSGDLKNTVRTRFAPSPTGYLHIGGLRTALYAYLFAKKNGGKFILRIEDTDQQRLVEGAVEIIYNTLKQAGLVYDEGPDVGGDYAPYIQSERKALYLPYAERLVQNGGAYYCFCSKERLDSLHESGHTKYDKHCLNNVSLDEARRRIERGEPYVIRQNIPLTGSSSYTDMVFGEITVDNAELEDNVLIKSDGLPTYNFANVVDDHLMAITHVIRGTEYLSSTPKYNLLYRGLGWEEPKYMHLQPIMRDSRHKLSKRTGDAAFGDYIEKGFLTQTIVNYIALLGWSPKENREKFSLDELRERFSVEGLSKSASVFDEQKMRWLNSLYIKELSDEEFCAQAQPFFCRADYLKGLDLAFLSKLLKPRCETLADVLPLTQFLTAHSDFDLELFEQAKQKSSKELARQILPALAEIAKESFDNLHDALVEFAQKNALKNGQVMWVFRIGITGAASTPGGAIEMALLLGQDECVKRLNLVAKRLG